MSDDELLSAITAPWGKEMGTKQPHPVVCHSLDTAAVAYLLYPIVLGRRFLNSLESDLAVLGDVRSWVSVLCGLHDLGKVTPIFQAHCAEIAINRMGPQAAGLIMKAKEAIGHNPPLDLKHGDATAVHFNERLGAWGASQQTALAIASAIGGHHGWIPDRATLREARGMRDQLGGTEWKRLRDAVIITVTDLWELPRPYELRWNEARLSLLSALGLAGLTSISDWIASPRRHFKWRPDITDADLPAYYRKSRDTARTVIDGLDWEPWRPTRTHFTDLFPTKTPRPLQATVQDFIESVDRPGALVIEAPTGEGKTKAGLQAATHLVKTLSLSGIYAALPTLSTGSAFYNEVNEMLAHTGDSLRAVPVHSGARQQMEAEKRKKSGSANTNQDNPAPDDDTPDDDAPHGIGEDQPQAEQIAETAAARQWYIKKNGLLAPIGVGTIDQALHAAGREWHNYVRLVGLSNKVLLVDEVHAYNTYTSHLLDVLLWWCGRLDVPVILMSATLTADRRDDLLRAWRNGAHGTGSSDWEPRTTDTVGSQLTWIDADNAHKPIPLESDQPTRTVHLEPISDEECVSWVLDRIGDHSSAMIVHATRARVWETADKLREELKARGLTTTELISIVGKDEEKDETAKTESDRAAAEADIHRLLGEGSGYPRNVIVVGTSLLENLDIDVDLIVSDLCPVDLLVQRLGRLHRHNQRSQPEHPDRPGQRIRPIHRHRLPGAEYDAEIGLLNMAGKEDIRLYKVGFPAGAPNIYNRFPLEAAWSVLAGRESLTLPTDVPELVRDFYRADPNTPAQRSFARSIDLQDYRASVPVIPLLTDHDTLQQITDRSRWLATRRNRGSRGNRT